MAASGMAIGDDLNPVAVFSVHDEPVDGSGDSFNAFTGLLRTQSTRADRAMQEFDVGAFAGFTVTSATISGQIFNNNAGGTFPRTFDFDLYSGNGAADLTDYQIASTKVGDASWASASPPLPFSFDVTAEVQALLDGGATHIGLKVIGTSSNLFPSILGDDAADAILTIEGMAGGGCVGDIADDFGNLGADGMVSFGDFLALLGLIGPCPGGTPGCTGDIADDFGNLGGDGMVSFGDFLALLGLIGPCP